MDAEGHVKYADAWLNQIGWDPTEGMRIRLNDDERMLAALCAVAEALLAIEARLGSS